jgi:EAL domain-containing protein (putative c-di-GMP-specific phosphodiesterase class I)
MFRRGGPHDANTGQFMSIAAPLPPAAETSATVRQILDNNGVVTFFQPILSARQRSVVGVEALSRGIIGVEALSRGNFAGQAGTGELIAPIKMFDMAAAEGLTLDLERACRSTALRTFAGLDRPEDMILFLNVTASALGTETDSVQTLLNELASLKLGPRNVAIEILESAFDDAGRLRELLESFREQGFLLVLDDVGVGYSNLERIPLIKPDILKLDRNLVIDIENDYHRQETFKALVQLSRRIGALVVAEGVETERQAIAALELGADLLQGYFLGRPAPSKSLANTEAAGRVAALGRRYKSYMIDRINQRKLQHRRFNIILNEILCELTRCNFEEFDMVLGHIIGGYPKVECIYVLDESGAQVTTTVCNPNVHHRAKGVMFRPAPPGADHSLKEYYYVLLDVELQKYTTDPYVSLASGNLCRTISTFFRDSRNNKMYILCIDVLCD